MKNKWTWKHLITIFAMIAFVISFTPSVYATGASDELEETMEETTEEETTEEETTEEETTEEETTEVKIATDSVATDSVATDSVATDSVATDSNAEEETEIYEEDFLENDLLDTDVYLLDLTEKVDGIFILDSSVASVEGTLWVEDGEEVELENNVTLKADAMVITGDVIVSLGENSKISVEIEGTSGAIMTILLADGANILKSSQFLSTSLYNEDGDTISFSTISKRGISFEWHGGKWVWMGNN